MAALWTPPRRRFHTGLNFALGMAGAWAFLDISVAPIETWPECDPGMEVPALHRQDSECAVWGQRNVRNRQAWPAMTRPARMVAAMRVAGSRAASQGSPWGAAGLRIRRSAASPGASRPQRRSNASAQAP